jgi:hypothetical protein
MVRFIINTVRFIINTEFSPNNAPPAWVWKLPERLGKALPHDLSLRSLTIGVHVLSGPLSVAFPRCVGSWTVDNPGTLLRLPHALAASPSSHLAAPWLSTATSSSPPRSRSSSRTALSPPPRGAGAPAPSTPPAWFSSRGAPGDDPISLPLCSPLLPKPLCRARV